MAIWQLIVLILVCGGLSFLMYGIWLVESDRDEFIKKYGYDPYRHGWKDKNDKDQDQ